MVSGPHHHDEEGKGGVLVVVRSHMALCWTKGEMSGGGGSGGMVWCGKRWEDGYPLVIGHIVLSDGVVRKRQW